ncbi:hypothetical protein KC19_9G129400 [Ceratodon purpureus]|uniref:Secreted protein n=1 Tax=Ceratodon purpureus TaxID=3225 RepID=A0A8T0GRG6_CERPU|nr:hypothetical protein KC19_9G129400 [Ceratodon purpureus]
MASQGTCYVLRIVAQFCLRCLLLMCFCSGSSTIGTFLQHPCLRLQTSSRSPHTSTALNTNLTTPSFTSSSLSTLGSVLHCAQRVLRHYVFRTLASFDVDRARFELQQIFIRRHLSPNLTFFCPWCWSFRIAKSSTNPLLRRIDRLVPIFCKIDTALELRTLIAV